eukprot:9500492-Pyramimonas_sp.AAC.2
MKSACNPNVREGRSNLFSDRAYKISQKRSGRPDFGQHPDICIGNVGMRPSQHFQSDIRKTHLTNSSRIYGNSSNEGTAIKFRLNVGMTRISTLALETLKPYNPEYKP